MARTTDAYKTRHGIVCDTGDRSFILDVMDEIEFGENAQIYDHKTKQWLVIRPSDLDPRVPTMRQVNKILKAHGIRPRRSPRGAR
jgi:hypothetical protein